MWQATPGAYQLSVRATDSDGFVQAVSGPGVFERVYPNGSNAIHSIDVSVTGESSS